MSKRTIETTVGVWLSPYAMHKVDELASLTPEELDACVSYRIQDYGMKNYPRIGEAKVSIKLDDAQTVQQARVGALREEARVLQAETQMKLTQIEGRIQSLLAIEHDGGVSA